MEKITRQSEVTKTWNHFEPAGVGLQRWFWLASFPRSGNTYFRMIFERMYQVRTFSIYATHEQCQFPLDATGDEPVCLIKTHAVPVSRSSRRWPAILLVRDGRETLASYARYRTIEMGVDPSDSSFMDFVRTQLLMLCTSRDWSVFYYEWLCVPQCFVVRFDSLVEDPVTVVAESYPWDRLGVSRHEVEAETFDELHAMAPQFFAGVPWQEVFDGICMDAFRKNHGDMQEKLGFEV